MVRCSTWNVFHIRQFCRFFNCFAWFHTVEFNRLPCHNDKKYDGVVFADRFRYPLTTFGFQVLIGLSRFLHAHISYETDNSKITAAFCWISYCLYDLIRLNSIVCRVQSKRCTMIWFSPIDFDINWLCSKCVLIGLSRLLDTHIAYEVVK